MYNPQVQIGLAAEKWNHYPPVALHHVMNNPTNEGLHKMSQNYYVYTHSIIGRNPLYVGKGNQRRIKQIERKTNPHHCSIVKKYGKENIIVKAMLCRSEKHAFDLEVRMIAALRSGGIRLANVTDGGEGASGHKASIETKRKISESQKGKVVSEKTRKLLSIASMGKKASLEVRLKMSELRKNMPQETRDKIANSLKGGTLSVGAILKREKTRKENDAVRKSHINSVVDKWRFIIEDKSYFDYMEKTKGVGNLKIPVICLSSGVIFESIHKASEVTASNRSKISDCCRGKRRHTNSLVFSFYEPYKEIMDYLNLCDTR